MITRVRRLLVLAAIFVFSVIMCLTLLIYEEWSVEEYLLENGRSKLHGFVVNTIGCKIPEVDPFDNSVRNFVSKLDPLTCKGSPPMTYVEGQYLRINHTALRLFYPNGFGYCEYQSITRPNVSSDNVFKYTEVVRIGKDTRMRVDFIRIACMDKTGSMMYTNFHTFILDKNEHLKQKLHKAYLASKHPKEVWNVIMIGVDSISQLNFIRQMPKTRDFLLDTLGAVEMKGYNKVADNTFVNLVPMFAGKYVEELPWDDVVNEEPFDRFPFIWRNFSSQGYRTLFGEDAPNIAIFNYDKPGFHSVPTDYYLRPFSLALEDHRSIWDKNHDCVGPTMETDIVLNWVHQFVGHFETGLPYWAFAFITRLTHDNITKASLAELPYLHFLQKLHIGGHLERSVLIFFSDHGMRFGDIRETYIGKLEERLPFMYIAVPQKLKVKYPKHYAALRLNSNRLTTPFDIYSTLDDLLHFTGHRKPNALSSRGMSLFSEVPAERTCGLASIAPHWCTCHEQHSIYKDSPEVKAAANHMISHINNALTMHHGLCATLTLDKVTDARAIKSRGQTLQGPKIAKGHIDTKVNSVHYLITVKTSPGGALFEATLLSDSLTLHPSFHISGDISRINMYGDQSTCIDYHKHKKFCYCL